jgi:hypothetical protein
LEVLRLEELVEIKSLKNMWRKDRNFERRKEGNTFGKRKKRKTILIQGRKKEDEFRQFRSKGGKKEKVLGRKGDSSYDSDERRRAFVWKKDRQFRRQGGKEEYVEER